MTLPLQERRTSWVFLLLVGLWIVPVLGGPGWSWLGFSAAALMSANTRLWWPAFGYTAIGFITLPLEDELYLDDLAVIIRTAAWVACIVHALIVFPGVLRRVAEGTGGVQTPQERRRVRDRARRAQRRAEAAPRGRAAEPAEQAARRESVPEQARPLAAAATRTREALVDQAAPAPAAPTVDVNKASRRDLAKLPGMDRNKAREAAAERDRRGGFASLDDFARVAGLQPHEAVRLRAHAFCSPRPRPPRTFARRVDL
ncbi:ComEA family DNA-binding protein [Microbacterium phosphatis]|uniref:ComEA family DNA-binding protein n=1 Tax=Microbacterium phosphatis TaxID=3140248 RepID=UPI0031408CB0